MQKITIKFNYILIMTKKSPLQIARAAYKPKLPQALCGAVKVIEGEPTPTKPKSRNYFLKHTVFLF